MARFLYLVNIVTLDKEITIDETSYFPKGSFFGQDLDGNWYYFVSHKNSPFDVPYDIHDQKSWPNKKNGTIRLFRDYWRLFTDGKCMIGSTLDTVFQNTPKTTIR